MAAKRGKSQARRNSGHGNGLPGWAWLVLGVVLTIIVILVAPKYLKGDGDGFLRPRPNPDAQPMPETVEEDALVVPEDVADTAKPTKSTGAAAGGKDTEYDFYTLLPGKEVAMTDAELAATERAEADRRATAQRKAQDAAKAPTASASDTAGSNAAATPATTPSTGTSGSAPLPKPIAEGAVTTPTSKPSTGAKPADAAPTASASSDDNTRYLLQAGAFQASGQAEELKAKIAMLGVGARVESAQIKGQTVYRVRMGPYGTASDLAEAKRKLSAGGLPAMAIKVE